MKKASFITILRRQRILLLTAVICLSIFSAKAQLTNTKWQGPVKIPTKNGQYSGFQTIWDFHQDTITISYMGGALPNDVMTYTEDNKVISIRKVSGGVPCTSDAVGKYSYEIKNDQLFMTKIEDACPVRGAVDISSSFDRVK